MPDIKDKHALAHLYNQILPKLAERIYQNITDIKVLFDDFGLEKIVDTWSKDRNASSDKEISLENGNVQRMGLRLRLSGFQKAGANAFDLSKDLLFKLETTWYEVGPDLQITWLQKSYFEQWTASEFSDIADQWVDSLMDDLTQEIQSVS